MADTMEGVAPDGTITTGARRDRVSATFEPVLRDAIDWVQGSTSSLYVYGSVANGTARAPTSDVDLLAIERKLLEFLGRERHALERLGPRLLVSVGRRLDRI